MGLYGIGMCQQGMMCLLISQLGAELNCKMDLLIHHRDSFAIFLTRLVFYEWMFLPLFQNLHQ